MARQKKVLVLGLDGVRPDALLAARTPVIDRLIEAGAHSLVAQTGAVPLSGPGWSSALCGVWADKHGVVDNSYEGKRFDQYPTFLARMQRAGLTVAALVGWDRIQEHLDGDFENAHSDDDHFLSQKACALLRQGGPDALFMHFDWPDLAGHEHGFHPDVPGYIDSIEACDRHIAPILATIDARPTRADEDWLIITTTDHGGSDKDHGIDIPSHRTIFVILNGDMVAKGPLTPAPDIVDVGATALFHMLGPADPGWDLDGRVIGLLAGAQPTRPGPITFARRP